MKRILEMGKFPILFLESENHAKKILEKGQKFADYVFICIPPAKSLDNVETAPYFCPCQPRPPHPDPDATPGESQTKTIKLNHD